MTAMKDCYARVFTAAEAIDALREVIDA